MFGKGAVIPFAGGSGVYEAGESYLTIKDIKAEATVTSHFIVEDFYLSFRID